ncbi:MAG: NADH-quinone oxidoreductase subunit N [Methanomassiliicoccaceae archaeon]|nr:NADH-quinone oxidoreductase subunit N [Methanomassiliicoccaceae archaeon]
MDLFGLDLTIINDVVKELMPIMPQVILIIAAIIVPVFGYGKRKGITAWLSLAAVTSALALTIFLIYDSYSGSFLNLFEFNEFTGFMMLIFMLVLFLVVLISLTESENRKHSGEYFSLLFVATIGMTFVAGATDLITLFVGIELASISSYALVAFRKNDPRSAEAAVKFLIIGGVSTAISLYGMSLLYGMTGTTELAAVADYLAAGDFTWVYIVAVIMLIAGFGFKLALVPFHAWAPDVYEGAPTPVATFLAAGSNKMGFIIFFKIFLIAFVAAQTVGGVPELQWLFAILAGVTMTVGNIIAITQTSIKRMLAYSSIAQAGYVLIVLAVATEYILAGGLFHMMTHVFMKGGAFIVVAALCARGIGEYISDYKGLAKRAPLVAAAMGLFMFSLAGIPPLAGFASKFILFSGAVTAEGTWIWLVALAVINSALSLYYYARVVKAMFVDKGATTEKIRVPHSFKFAIAICAVATVAMGLYLGPIMEICEAAAAAFFAMV